jgi:hypothetical protein
MLTLFMEMICQWCSEHGLTCIDFGFHCDGRPTCRDCCHEVNCSGINDGGLPESSSYNDN